MDNIEKELFDGYATIGTCVLNSDYMVLLLEETPEHPDFDENTDYRFIRLVTHNLSAPPEGRWGILSFDTRAWNDARIIPTIEDEFLIADSEGLVFYGGVGDNKKLLDMIMSGDEYPYLNDLAYIDGQVYGCGVNRRLFKKTTEGDWEINDEANKIAGIENQELCGFSAIDGFSQNEIYCVGFSQDVFLFNGKNWRALDVADGRFHCYSVHCGEDGLVYIGFRDGRVARGRDDQWEVTSSDDALSTVIGTITTYRGRVFIGTNYGTYLLNEDLSFTPYDFDGELNFSGGGYVHSAHGCMIIASRFNQVAFFDGEKWLNIKDCDILNPDEEEANMQALLEEAQALIDEVEDYIKTQGLDEK